MDNAAKKAAESVGNRVGNAAVDTVKKFFDEALILSGNAFTRYLENAVKRYNSIKTIATGIQPRLIIGENALYVQINVSHQGVKYSTQHIEKLLPIRNHLLIEGTGGAGKSMLMRYLFLDTAYAFLSRGGNYIPVLLELRSLSAQFHEDTSDEKNVEFIFTALHSCMLRFDAQLDRNQIESSLRSGKFLFLLDGFDEIPEQFARNAANAIHLFCKKYPKNPCVVTSRPHAYTVPLETFSVLKTAPLTKIQAKSLAAKLWDSDEKTVEFCNQLDRELFDKHRDFAENPLLLTMMFLTFMRNLSIPEHLSEFYQKAYEALYSAHDNQDKGVFKREFKCKTLDEHSFTRLFSYFCFQSYFKKQYEFSKGELLIFLNKGIEKLGFPDLSAEDYLKDLQNIVCMLVKDGTLYKFSHRNFQMYFAALYTRDLTDDEQKNFFFRLLSSDDFWNNLDYYHILFQLSSDRFISNSLEHCIRTMQAIADSSPDPKIAFLKYLYSYVRITIFIHDPECFCVDRRDFSLINNLMLLSDLTTKAVKIEYADRESGDYARELSRKAYNILTLLRPSFMGELDFEVDFKTIDASPRLTQKTRNELYHTLAEITAAEKTWLPIRQWLSKLDEQRKELAASDFDDFLDAL